MSDRRRERALRFLDGESPERPVCLQTYLGLFLENRRRHALADIYRGMLGDSTEMTLSFEQVSEAQLAAWEAAWSALRRPPAWMPVRGWPTNSAEGTRVLLEHDRVLVAPPGAEPVDVVYAATASDRDIWDRREAVDTDAMPDPPTLREALADGWAEHPRRFVDRWGEEYLIHGHIGTPYGAAYSRLGFGGMMEAMVTEPELLEAIIDNHLRHLVTRLEIYAEAGVECVFVEETLSSSDLISEVDYLRFSFRSTRELLQHARDQGLRTVYYYCGAVENRLHHLGQIPADALAFEESKKGFDIDLTRVREEIGADRPLLGNIDAVLIRDGSDRAVLRAVEEQFAAAGPLLATSAGSPLTPDTGTRRMDFLVRITEECRCEAASDQ
ncbi:MAG: uroporphyrinogen decarboxylase family protein [Armatimonadota bacterium]